MRVLIVGGGIAGIMLAYFLQEKHEVVIVEKGSHWRTIGYIVGIWKNGLDILRKLPLQPAFWERMYSVEQGAILAEDGRPLSLFSFPDVLDGESVAQTIERETLHESIRSLLTNRVGVRFETFVQSIIPKNGEVEVRFESGFIDHFDLVVGADGIGSKVRSLVFGDYMKFYGWNFWGAWIPSEAALTEGYLVMGAAGECVLGFPYRDRHLIGFLYKAEPSQITGAPKDAQEILGHFPLLAGQIDGMIKAIAHIPAIFHDTLRFVSMKKWFKGRVVLIGDAQHAMSPLTGIGTSLALEDAFVLAEELNATQDIDRALKRFAKRRDKRYRDIEIFRKMIESVGLISSGRGIIIRNIVAWFIPRTFPLYWLRKIFQAQV